MRHRTLDRIAGWILALGVLGPFAAPLAGQVPPVKKVIADTAKKPAQDTSVKHVKIVKETRPKESTSGGEVCAPVTCAPNKTAIDSAVAEQRRVDDNDARVRMERMIVQMQNGAEFRRDWARNDSVAREAEAQAALKRHLARGFYIGLAGGASMPERATRNGYTGGWNTTIPFGWDANDLPLGVRTDFTIDHLNGTRVHDQYNATTAASGDITVWSLNADLKLRAHAPGATSRTNVYLLGGFGAHRVVNGVYGTSGEKAGQNLDFGDAKTSLGWNVGAGASIGWGPTELFIESRFFQVKSDLAYHMNGGIGTYTSFTPIVVGLQWF